MPDYFLYFEILNDPFNNTIKKYFKMEEMFERIGAGAEYEYCTKIINEKIKNDLEHDFKKKFPNFQIYDLYYIQFLFYYGEKFDFLIVHFSDNHSLYVFKEKIKELNSIIDLHPEILRIHRIFLNFNLNIDLWKDMLNLIDRQKENTSLKDFRLPEGHSIKDFKASKFILENTPFFIEFIQRFPLNIDSELEKLIKSYFDKNFPEIVNDLRPTDKSDILIGPGDITGVKLLEKNDLINTIKNKLKDKVYKEISRFYYILDEFYFKNLYNWLNRTIQIYKNYDTKSLKLLREYLEDFRREISVSSSSPFPRFFISILEENAFKVFEKKDPNIILMNDTHVNYTIFRDHYKYSLLTKISDLYRSYLNLLEIINENLSVIKNLIVSKEERKKFQLAIFDSPNQTYFFKKGFFNIRINEIDKFIFSNLKSKDQIIKYAFITETVSNANRGAINFLENNSGWNIILVSKEKKTDVDAKLQSFVIELSNLYSNEWDVIYVISSDFELVNFFLKTFQSFPSTSLYFLTNPDDLTLLSISSLEKYTIKGFDINIYTKKNKK